MKQTKTKDLRTKDEAELTAMLLQEQSELFNARKDLVFRRLTDTTSIKGRRHNIARLMTVIAEKRAAGSAS